MHEDFEGKISELNGTCLGHNRICIHEPRSADGTEVVLQFARAAAYNLPGLESVEEFWIQQQTIVIVMVEEPEYECCAVFVPLTAKPNSFASTKDSHSHTHYLNITTQRLRAPELSPLAVPALTARRKERGPLPR